MITCALEGNTSNKLANGLKMYYDVNVIDVIASLCIIGWAFMIFVHLVAIVYG